MEFNFSLTRNFKKIAFEVIILEKLINPYIRPVFISHVTSPTWQFSSEESDMEKSFQIQRYV